MSDNDILNHIFTKEITCPVCNNKFNVNVVKVKSPRITSKDSDFFIRYSSINPYFYDVWSCNNCGYSAIKSDFLKIKSFQKDLVLNKLTPKWTPKTYPDIFNEDTSIKRYKLALVTSIIIDNPSSSNAIILLKIAWMYRLKNDNANERLFLVQALSAFYEAYNNEDFPICGMYRDAIYYLLGDLNRRTNNTDEALIWYRKVFDTSNPSIRIKQLSKNGIDMIKHHI